MIKLKKGGKPTNKQALTAVNSSYEKQPIKNIDNYKLIYDGINLDGFIDLKNKDILIAIKGTSNFKDLISWINLGTNKIQTSQRFKEDLKDFNKILKKYPPTQYTYFLASHSLGSTVSNKLLELFPFITSTINFNGAISNTKKELNNSDKIKYHYIDKDILYKTVGKQLKNKNNVKTYKYIKKNKTVLDKFLPVSIKAHKLEQFDNRF